MRRRRGSGDLGADAPLPAGYPPSASFPPGDLRWTRRERRDRVRWIQTSLPLVFAAAAAYAYVRFGGPPFWTVRAIEVAGNRSVATSELLERLDLRPGMPWWRVPRGAANRVRAEEPRLAALRIGWSWPRDLTVSVRERESALRILGPPALEVSLDGTVFEPREAIDPADLPLLTGQLPAELRPGSRLSLPAPGWRELLEIPAWSPVLWKSISEIHYAGGRDFQLFLRDGRKVVLWETGINDDLKRELPAILGDLRRDRVEDAVLDLRFREQVVVRLPRGALADSAAADSAGALGAARAGHRAREGDRA